MEVTYSDTSRKQLEKLDIRIHQKILFTIDKFKKGERVDIIKLKNKDEEFRIRAGNYRIQLQKVKEGFLVTKLGKRENFYLVFL